jgi:quercetin dioxygenase-like cupin family protein
MTGILATHEERHMADAIIPTTGRQLTLPDGPIFNLRRADESDYDIGAFRPWAGYKAFGAAEATRDLAHFQHVLSFAGSQTTGRTGIHGHFAHVHIVIPTSGRGVFSYDGVATEAVPGGVIVQHGGTIHDQFEYSYAADSDADNRATPQTVEPTPAGAPQRSFGFLELFVPRVVADVEIVPPKEVTDADHRTAWDHPYHAAGARFCVQNPDCPAAAYRPVAMRPDLEARDAGTWESTARLVATWIIRPASSAASTTRPLGLEIVGEKNGVSVLYMVAGSARFLRSDGEEIVLGTGDALTHGQGLVGDPFDYSPDMRLIRFFVAARAQLLRERTPDEIKRLEALGPRIITRREVRPDGDARPVNFLQEDEAATMPAAG